MKHHILTNVLLKKKQYFPPNCSRSKAPVCPENKPVPLSVNSVYLNASVDLSYMAVRMTLLPEILRTFQVLRLSETLTFVMDAQLSGAAVLDS